MSVYLLEHESSIDFDGPISVTSGAVVNLTASKLSKSTRPPVIRAIITVEGAAIRYTTAPASVVTVSSTVGHLLNIGDVVIVEGIGNINQFQCIAVSTTATIQISYQAA